MSEVKSTDIYIDNESFKAVCHALNMANLMEAVISDHELQVLDLDDEPLQTELVRQVLLEGHKALAKAKYRP